MNFRSVSLMISLPDGATEAEAKVLEQKLTDFATQNNLSAMLDFSAMTNVGPQPAPAPTPKK